MSPTIVPLLSSKVPIVLPPMAGAAGGLLAAKVTKAGGFGFVAIGYDSIDSVHKELELARRTLDLPAGTQLPLGVGFLGWILDKSEDEGRRVIDAALSHNVQAVWLSFGHNLAQWVKYVRERDSKLLIFIQASSLEEAKVAIHDWNVDVVVAQGNESGGHGAGNAPPVREFVVEVLAEAHKRGHPPYVLAAGGLANGFDVASMLSLGASGAVLGTRFLLSSESLYTDAQKATLINATANSTVRTMAFDQARGTLGWPSGIDGRALKNDTVADYDAGEDVEVIRSKFQEAVQAGDPNRMLVWAGTGVDRMTRVQPAEQIVAEIAAEYTSTIAPDT